MCALVQRRWPSGSAGSRFQLVEPGRLIAAPALVIKALDIPKTLLDPELQNRVELPEKSQSPQAVI